ncbi:hypothetical protein [Christiangramia sp. SM2212]|uniref:PliI/PliC-like inhibitor of I-type lysozyme n=1 Tax=Christiangramia sediminicola TaxID=3073267 RepID=A0ABU1EPP1_9FLAO|nr:hypothetical protein [Christiangramia sp. SM2212]MDR5590347.1 hypothetical protein [Christiangramia sp. SM2212]
MNLKSIFKILVFLSILGCKESKPENDQVNDSPNNSTLNIIGNYVSDSYNKRDEGYDWLAINIQQVSSENYQLKVRSRADKKRPTCLMDLSINKVSEGEYSGILQGKKIMVDFSKDSLRIYPENKSGEAVLSFYCSGGATVAGSYSKITSEIDPDQVDKTLYHKNLMLQNIGFIIKSIQDEKEKVLQIQPYGLSINNDLVSHSFKGRIKNAEIEDLNSDGYPEILVYIVTPDNFGKVIGYSVNNGKSMSMIYLPEIQDNADFKNDYQGFDDFAIAETSLIRRFPVYNNSIKTDTIKQIVYKLKDGENSRKFEIESVDIYSLK